MAFLALRPNAWVLAAGVLLDLVLGDPTYALHPVRLIGRSLAFFETRLRRAGLDGYGGGVLLFLLLSVIWVGGIFLLTSYLPRNAALALDILLVYSLVALRDLLRHGWAVEQAASRGNLAGARVAVSMLVGRDTAYMDIAACRRAAIESLSENLADGFTSPLFWYCVLGIPGLVLFKIVSTMDSMVGYKTPRYLRFGWCGARTDDLMNWAPARLTWLVLAISACLVPRCSPYRSFLIGWRQHAIVPGPNAGWSEAPTAGAIRRRLVGPIWAGGEIVTELWLGDPSDPPAADAADFRRSAILITVAGLLSSVLAIVVLC